MTDVSKQLAEALFKEINENMHLAEKCWRKSDTGFEAYFKQAKKKIREFESLLTGR